MFDWKLRRTGLHLTHYVYPCPEKLFFCLWTTFCNDYFSLAVNSMIITTPKMTSPLNEWRSEEWGLGLVWDWLLTTDWWYSSSQDNYRTVITPGGSSLRHHPSLAGVYSHPVQIQPVTWESRERKWRDREFGNITSRLTTGSEMEPKSICYKL